MAHHLKRRLDRIEAGGEAGQVHIFEAQHDDPCLEADAPWPGLTVLLVRFSLDSAAHPKPYYGDALDHWNRHGEVPR